jgi:two-component system chemotaxis response regulator CheY
MAVRAGDLAAGSITEERACKDQHGMKTEKKNNTKILVVDDFSSMRKMFRKLLSAIGFQHIVEARDAAEAIHRLEHDRFDLIFSDWNMPSMSGQELLEFVRSQDKLKDIPFIMITVQADKDTVTKARDGGVSQYLTKPFTAEDLGRKVRDVMRLENDSGSEDSHGRH